MQTLNPRRLGRINKRLDSHFHGQVKAVLEEDCLVLTGELDRWEDAVKAGQLAVKGLGFRGFVNKVRTGSPVPPMVLPERQDRDLEGRRPDVLIIGGGVIGCAAARELSRYSLDILLVEKEHDLAMHASGRNDGMIHPGIDLFRGTRKYLYNKRGNPMYDKLARELGVPFKRTGQYLCFSGPLMFPFLSLTRLYWKFQGIPGVKVIGKKELRRREPGLKADITQALFFPSAGVICPFDLTIALGENAVENGAEISLETAVTEMETQGGRIIRVKTNRGALYPRAVINAAGVFADEVAAMAGDQFYSIHPRRGTNIILDKKAGSLLPKGIASRIVLVGRGKPASLKKPSHTKGGGVVRTVFGNTLVGPDAVETPEREDFATRRESINASFAKFQQTVPALSPAQIITYFTGIRAAAYEEDFILCRGRRCSNLVHAGGIQSPGLTAAPAIALETARLVREILLAQGRNVEIKADFNPVRKPIPRTADLGDQERQRLIEGNPDYGLILCRCEEVSRGEILEALRRPVPCDTLDGVKRRVRPGSGRCQGAFCGPLILELIAKEKGLPLEGVTKSGPGSAILRGALG
ncbi:MAG: FAD-dependent oxidoreductase [Spirochaetales bacterium]|jgi:glycerol-3-phosphate dehydrogenase|nr:FAD-dependent oxidoreductase [Spirochaetales bacterium]